MQVSTFATKALFTFGAMAVATAIGCESNGKNGSGDVSDRNQSQHTNPDGSQVRERSQVRQMPDGQAVKETEIQKREPVAPNSTAQ